MEIQLMNTITGFEAGINSLENPSVLSRLSPLSAIGEFSKLYSFWTWGAIILAAIATFSSILHKTKMLFLRLRDCKSVIPDTLVRFDDDPFDESCSSSSESDDEAEPSTLKGRINERSMDDEDFGVKGICSFDEDRCESSKSKWWSSSGDEWSSGGVVKFWDELGFGFENSSGLISMLDLNRGEIIRSFLAGGGQIPAICVPSPAVVMSAGVENMRQVALRVWDARVGGRVPSVVAEWQPRRRQVVGIDSGGVEKVYVSEEDRSSVVVRDMRNAGSPLEEMTECDGQTWFDADAVMVGDDSDGEGYDAVLTEDEQETSVATRCRNAVRSYLF
ncbi:uncharacterized protein LOC131237644 [Magnolia sinica]|uniref:uncharacterized protein LOC131237644 n=1 Tax=Magnolia sinica TaxID=86752 RepID=UPI002658286F|nr:uncharacterized protein LOC131237644 [Magnolia sinica]